MDKRLLVLCVCSLAAACEREPPRPAEAPEIRAPETAFTTDTIAQFTYTADQPNIDFDTLRAAMTRVEQQLAGGAAESEMPQLLLRLGIMKLAHEPPVEDTAGLAYVKGRPAEFFYNEFHHYYGYNGHHFREIINRFPRSGLADDAAYLLTKLAAQGQECEGWVPCYLHVEWRPAREFLTAYPTSPLADSAFSNVVRVFDMNIDPAKQSDDFTTDQKEVSQIVEAVDSVTPNFAEPLKTRATEATRRWRSWLARTR